MYDAAMITHVGEEPQRAPLVFDAVLRADDRDVGFDQHLKGRQGGGRILALEREHDHVARPERNLVRTFGHGHVQRAPARGRAEPQTLRCDRAAVIAARDEKNVAARFEEPRADRSADRADSVNDVSHGARV
jgi:hypothetical protein